MVCALAIAIQAWLVETLVRLSKAWQPLMFAVFSHQFLQPSVSFNVCARVPVWYAQINSAMTSGGV